MSYQSQNAHIGSTALIHTDNTDRNINVLCQCAATPQNKSCSYLRISFFRTQRFDSAANLRYIRQKSRALERGTKREPQLYRREYSAALAHR